MHLIDVSTVRFDEPGYLWFLAAPAVLLVLWAWRLGARRRDTRRFRVRRRVPVRERLPLFGGLLFWLCLILATACAIVALARPVATVSLVRTAGVDLVILQDGSASMRTADVDGNRWQRSMRFLRVLGESLQWTHDRIAMALFAHIAAPQVRLTSDPNTFFFFLDHLNADSPFRQEDDTTWDTNIELGVYWGIRLIEKDEQLHGKSPNAKMFILISDGQSWSGQVERSIREAQTRNIPIFAVGVGTSAGGDIPQPVPQASRPGQIVIRAPDPMPVHSSLDRASLARISTAGGGQYMELDRETDRDIANRVIDAARRRAGTRSADAATEDLYWRCLLAAAAFVGLGVLFLQERAELWLQAAGAAAILAAVLTLTR